MIQPNQFIEWLRPFAIDARGLAATRISLGLVAFYDALTRFGLIRVFYTDAGVTPRDLILTGSQKYQSFFSISGSYSWAAFLMTMHALLALLFMIGYRTRLMTLLLAMSLWSLINRNPTLSHAGNHLLVWLLIWALFVPLNLRAAVDTYTSRARPRVRRVASIATAGMLLQVAFMYWLAFFTKTHGDWRSDFSAVYYFLNSHLSTPLGYAFGQSVLLTQIATVGSLALELFGPLFALITFSMPRTRMAIVIAFVLFHLGLVAMMYVGTFSFICIGAWLLYVPTPVWDSLTRRGGGLISAIARRWNRLMAGIASLVGSIPGMATRTITLGPTNRVALGAIGALLVYVCVVNFASALPKGFTGPLAKLPRLKQSWAMMDVPWRYFHTLALEIEQVDGTVHIINPTDAPDGLFQNTIVATHKPDQYWKVPVWRAQTTWLVAYRAALVNGALEKKPDNLVAYMDFHRRKWNEFHPSPSQQVKSMKAFAEVHWTKTYDGTPLRGAPTARHQLFSWPR